MLFWFTAGTKLSEPVRAGNLWILARPKSCPRDLLLSSIGKMSMWLAPSDDQHRQSGAMARQNFGSAGVRKTKSPPNDPKSGEVRRTFLPSGRKPHIRVATGGRRPPGGPKHNIRGGRCPADWRPKCDPGYPSSGANPSVGRAPTMAENRARTASLRTDTY